MKPASVKSKKADVVPLQRGATGKVTAAERLLCPDEVVAVKPATGQNASTVDKIHSRGLPQKVSGSQHGGKASQKTEHSAHQSAVPKRPVAIISHAQASPQQASMRPAKGLNGRNAAMDEVPIFSWLHGGISRVDAENLLSAARTDGVFLVRKSTSKQGAFVVSLCWDRKYRHHLITPSPEGLLFIGRPSRCRDLGGLIERLRTPCTDLHWTTPLTRHIDCQSGQLVRAASVKAKVESSQSSIKQRPASMKQSTPVEATPPPESNPHPQAPAEGDLYYAITAHEPPPDSDKLGLAVGEIVELIEPDDSGWWLVLKGDIEGWVPADFLEPAPEGTVAPSSSPAPKPEAPRLRTATEAGAKFAGITPAQMLSVRESTDIALDEPSPATPPTLVVTQESTTEPNLSSSDATNTPSSSSVKYVSLDISATPRPGDNTPDASLSMKSAALDVPPVPPIRVASIDSTEKLSEEEQPKSQANSAQESSSPTPPLPPPPPPQQQQQQQQQQQPGIEGQASHRPAPPVPHDDDISSPVPLRNEINDSSHDEGVAPPPIPSREDINRGSHHVAPPPVPPRDEINDSDIPKRRQPPPLPHDNNTEMHPSPPVSTGNGDGESSKPEDGAPARPPRDTQPTEMNIPPRPRRDLSASFSDKLTKVISNQAKEGTPRSQYEELKDVMPVKLPGDSAADSRGKQYVLMSPTGIATDGDLKDTEESMYIEGPGQSAHDDVDIYDNYESLGTIEVQRERIREMPQDDTLTLLTRVRDGTLTQEAAVEWVAKWERGEVESTLPPL